MDSVFLCLEYHGVYGRVADVGYAVCPCLVRDDIAGLDCQLNRVADLWFYEKGAALKDIERFVGVPMPLVAKPWLDDEIDHSDAVVFVQKCVVLRRRVVCERGLIGAVWVGAGMSLGGARGQRADERCQGERGCDRKGWKRHVLLRSNLMGMAG